MMATAHASTPQHDDNVERTRSLRLCFLSRLRYKKKHSTIRHPQKSISPPHSPVPRPTFISRLPTNTGLRESLSFSIIAEDFSNLRYAIDAHVHKYYSVEPNDGVASQAMIEHASTGIMIPWPQVRSLLYESTSRLATLALCVSWTILSRCLLLKLGLSHNPGSTFLPPEIVECFQSFALGKCAVSLEIDESKSVNLALLSRWKQISATLLHSTYVVDAFSHFDSRTVNIERALKDLDPLLSTYATSQDASHAKGARLADLRDILRRGAKLAFTLFSQPCFWKFDWTSDRAAENGKLGLKQDPFRAPSIGGMITEVHVPVVFTPAEIVVWPALLRVIDDEGVKLVAEEKGEGYIFGEKRYLTDFEDM